MSQSGEYQMPEHLKTLISRVADLNRQGERSEVSGTVIKTGPGGMWAINLAQLDQVISDARAMLGQPPRRSDYDA